MANDVFANIAADGIGGRKELLYDPSPVKIKEKACKLKSALGTVPVATAKKMDTREELYAALADERKRYAPYLENKAPAFEGVTERIEITDFTLDGNEKVTIPHYGGPQGVAKKVYESTFTLDKVCEDKAYYICFGGVDYYATVYVNGECVGKHEGFFSPFEFDIGFAVKAGENALRVVVENDCIYGGNAFASVKSLEGDKLYAATGLGWDDPLVGWHHCPPGMGIYNKVGVEIRNRIHIYDLFVRPLVSEGKAEIWAEIQNTDHNKTELSFNLSVYGQNFEGVVFENMSHTPATVRTVGRGDSLTEAQVKDSLGNGIPMPAQFGINVYKFTVDIPDAKIWDLDTPYLYQLQLELVVDGKTVDRKKSTFGMRTFTEDNDSTPKGMFYLNGRKIRLRGANTMGFEQQDVLRGDFEQLIDDILLAKLCNMNFLRLTQRPVQDEIYQYCDMLGLMTQSDLPLFGCMRRNKFPEGVRQAEEMERMVRNHPCNVVVSYINEPFPNAKNEPHRHLTRDELATFFTSCDHVVLLSNPDRVIKHIDGDYDPPCESLPDNHCYPMWYNGHGIDIGRLHKGYWLSIKPGWYCGCGEFGAEGLDFCDVMRESYPKDWLTEPFFPGNIVNAQTGSFYHFFYDKQDTMEDWVKASHAHQAFATSIMTEAFRRNNLMITFAIHLFIDAWPSGWMKTIMDCRRNPKPAFFAYRNALEPVLVSLRTDRFTYYSGEKVKIEAHICNDTQLSGKSFKTVYELYNADGTLVMRGEAPASINACEAAYSSSAVFTAPAVSDREKYVLKAILVDENGKEIAHNTQGVEVFAPVSYEKNPDVELITMLKPGEYEIAGEKVTVKGCGMLPLHFASRKSGHPMVSALEPKDISYFYNKKEDMITPLLYATFKADGFTPILISGNTDANGDWGETLAAAEKVYNGKRYIICQVDLREENPIAQRLVASFYAK